MWSVISFNIMIYFFLNMQHAVLCFSSTSILLVSFSTLIHRPSINIGLVQAKKKEQLLWLILRGGLIIKIGYIFGLEVVLIEPYAAFIFYSQQTSAADYRSSNVDRFLFRATHFSRQQFGQRRRSVFTQVSASKLGTLTLLLTCR